ncbi:kunitz-type protease inhibitor 2 isoform X2 [Sander lucioperca]|uniref:kunitz-type protease inhibitor 2 isoform X2 n=1 Tax=Sander lucioperca TaxID=283035 RepID=UPI001653AF37|nr:kunitz-type protease inhibitor 2 isoform X2 [Sander lucioperca]
MSKMMHRVPLLFLCFLLTPGPALALDCAWDPDVDPDQALDPVSLVSTLLPGRNNTVEGSDPRLCREACCQTAGCDLALLGFPMDGRPQCMLVQCVRQGRDMCVFRPSTQFKIYRKKVPTDAETKSQEGGEELRVVPLGLLGEINETDSIRCRLPMKVGLCRAAFPRFYYDVTNQSCRSFTYGGCDANENHFNTREECEASCSGVTGSVLPDESTPAPDLPPKARRLAPVDSNVSGLQKAELVLLSTDKAADDFAERCGAEPDGGHCRAAFQHWYYNSKTGSCQTFMYGGCRGNRNNYFTEEDCINSCTVQVLPSKKDADDDDEVSAEYKDGCMVTSDPGPCRAAFPMFYYDASTASCQTFMYGGCRGNNNRYGSEEECLSRCSTGSIDFHGNPRKHLTTAVFLFVTLAAVSALLLAALAVLTLRRHRLSRSTSSASDKEELLPEDDHSSLESLSAPGSPKLDNA